MNENRNVYQVLERALNSLFVELHAVYDPDAGEPFPDCYMAAVDLFAPGQTYKLYFRLDEKQQPEVVHLERWYFG